GSVELGTNSPLFFPSHRSALFAKTALRFCYRALVDPFHGPPFPQLRPLGCLGNTRYKDSDILLSWRHGRFYLAPSQELRLGRRHLACASGVAHLPRHSSQL